MRSVIGFCEYGFDGERVVTIFETDLEEYKRGLVNPFANGALITFPRDDNLMLDHITHLKDGEKFYHGDMSRHTELYAWRNLQLELTLDISTFET